MMSHPSPQISSNNGPVIILCAGSLNLMNLPVGTNVSNAMVPVNGKPVIGWILDDLLTKGVTDVTVVLRKENERLALFLGRAYGSRARLTTACLEREGTILDSLDLGLRSSRSDGPIRVLLGDTLIEDPFDVAGDFVYVREVLESQRWCVVRTGEDGRIIDFLDKQRLPGRSHLAVVGYYQFTDGVFLKQCVTDARAANARELSDALKQYARRQPLLARHAAFWYDFGHVDNFVQAKRTLLRPRFFNSLTVDPALNTIRKVSTNNDKLQDELSWYLTIPADIQVLAPRIVSHRLVGDSLEVVQEYYGYPTLAELFVYGDLPVDAWRSILKRVFAVHEVLRRHEGDAGHDDVVDMYLFKTKQRIQSLAHSSPEWSQQLERDQVTLNGRSLQNVPVLMEMIERDTERLANSVVPSIIHGDLCFSNILFDFTNQILRLIDPRGRFGRKGIYGDPRYDMAKLRHSVRGLYDFIMADMFQIHVQDGSATAEVYADDVAGAVGDVFDEMLVDAGYDVKSIQFIEGLQFLSMLPLHQDRPMRQQMMYFTGLKLLNEVL